MVSIPIKDLQEGKRVRATDTLRDDVASMQARRMPVPVPAGPMGSPQAGPQAGPMGGPQAGPMGGPQAGPTGGPQAGPQAGPMGGPPMGGPPMGGPPMGGSKSILYNKLQEVALASMKVLTQRGMEGTETEKELDEQERMTSQIPVPQDSYLQNIGGSALGFDPREATSADGGLIGMAAGGEFMGRVPGDGHGMEDNVYMPIREGKKDVGTLAVSPSEYVVDSYTMAALGNGNADEGAEIMDEVVEGVRKKAYGNRQQPNEINGLAALKPMLERV
jgi:hypothetical protein